MLPGQVFHIRAVFHGEEGLQPFVVAEDAAEAVDGLDALAALDRIRPDIIVLDLRMPHLDGMGFLRQMDRRGWKVPVIVCSGTFTMDSPPAIPGVFPAQKSPDLRNIWSALEAALPRPAEIESSLVKSRTAAEETVWRD